MPAGSSLFWRRQKTHLTVPVGRQMANCFSTLGRHLRAQPNREPLGSAASHRSHTVHGSGRIAYIVTLIPPGLHQSRTPQVSADSLDSCARRCIRCRGWSAAAGRHCDWTAPTQDAASSRAASHQRVPIRCRVPGILVRGRSSLCTRLCRISSPSSSCWLWGRRAATRCRMRGTQSLQELPGKMGRSEQ